jgi:hypothetical protein
MVALGGFARPFFIHHSSFFLRPSVALDGVVPPFCILHSAFNIRPVVASGGVAPHFCFLLSAFCFSSVVALAGFARPFCILHSAFNIHPVVALDGFAPHFCFLLSALAWCWLWLAFQVSGFSLQVSSLIPGKPGLDHEIPEIPEIADICRNRGAHKMGEQGSTATGISVHLAAHVHPIRLRLGVSVEHGQRDLHDTTCDS